MVNAACRVLEDGEFFGRCELHLQVGGMGEVFLLDLGNGNPPGHMHGGMPFGGEITLPREDDDHTRTIRQFRGDYARAGGVLDLRA